MRLQRESVHARTLQEATDAVKCLPGRRCRLNWNQERLEAGRPVRTRLGETDFDGQQWEVQGRKEDGRRKGRTGRGRKGGESPG